MKKVLAIFLACFIMLSMPAFSALAEAADTLNIVCTTFPQYDWVRTILGDNLQNVSMTMLLDNGVDLHSYQPTAQDIAKVSACDLFIYVGGESDAWVDDMFETLGEQSPKSIRLMDLVETVSEEIVEGMEHTHEDEHETVDPSSIEDRALSSWNGSWTSVFPFVESGALQEFVDAKAEENEESALESWTRYLRQYATGFDKIEINENQVTFTAESGAVTADYAYAGYKAVDSDHGTSVWYTYENTDADSAAPRYLAFNDHGYTNEEADADEIGHYHMRYSNDDLDGLITLSGWAPTFFTETATAQDITEALLGHSHEHEEETDEHVWLSLKNAEKMVQGISETLGEIDAENAAMYAENAAAYIESLAALDSEYQAVVDNAQRKVVLFADRFPFRYLAQDYGLTYYAAFSGCSAETEASFETVAFLAGKVDELQLPVVLVIEGDTHAIAETVVANTTAKNQQILVMNSLQSVTSAAVEDGANYLSIMTQNLESLKAALN